MEHEPGADAHTQPEEAHGTSQGTSAARNSERWTDPKYPGRIIHLNSDDHPEREYVFKWPNAGHMGRYSREAMGGNTHKAARNLVMALLLFPDRSEIEAQFEALPGLPIALANEVNKLAGLTEEFTVKN